ncbi:MAG: hypothetical protein PWR31_1949, partial [Bacillota bacterium]|nr:hypothetical protein [Bacillota bacterium]
GSALSWAAFAVQVFVAGEGTGLRLLMGVGAAFSRSLFAAGGQGPV